MPKTSNSIVLIHGLWMTALSWEKWVGHYSDKGYRVVAKSWPGMDVPIDELRRDPSPIATLGVTEIVNHYEKIISEIDGPSIIIGHSFGGLIAQILLDRGLGAAGVAIAPAPVKGIIFLPFSTLRVSFPALINPANVQSGRATYTRPVSLCLHEQHERGRIAGCLQPICSPGT
jgi:pimeloyl-ACP methyl ester carboxylesterase